MRILDLLHGRGDQLRAGLHPPIDHELGEADELIEILLDARLGDEAADFLLGVDQPLVLQLGQRAPHGRAGRAEAFDELRLRRQPRMRLEDLRKDVMPN
jgi:hypothetical protein